jgi:ATP-binding cassette subfamily C exporter for protease/lipase
VLSQAHSAGDRGGRSAPSELVQELWRHRRAYGVVANYALASGVIASASWLYTMQVYDRVVTTRSVDTLITLTGLVLFAYVMMEVIEWVRNEILRAVAKEVDASLSERVFDVVYRGALRRNQDVAPSAMQDLKTLTQFMYSPSMGLLIDLPVALLNLLIIFLINPIMGAWSLVGAGVQAYLTFRSQQSTMMGMRKATEQSTAATRYATLAVQNAEAFHAMGMTAGARQVWKAKQASYLDLMAEASTIAGQKAALSKTMQFAQSSLLLGLGCYLTIKGILGGPSGSGAVLMLIASILGGRGIGPLVALITQWQGVAMAWSSFQRLDRSLKAMPAESKAMTLPAPQGRLSIERLYAKAPASDSMTIKGVHAEVAAGSLVAVIGPSASGKTSLARCLVGVWLPDAGSVRLDGAPIHLWPREQLGEHIGYLPQEVELFEGSLAENISRFGPYSEEALSDAIQSAGLGDLVASLSEGIHTPLGPDGHFLSGGQRQRVGLARALYGRPRVVVMDEPDAHLDRAGDAALQQALKGLQAQGTTCIVITHRHELLAMVDSILVMHDGQMAAFGPREQVLKALEASRKPALVEQLERA